MPSEPKVSKLLKTRSCKTLPRHLSPCEPFNNSKQRPLALIYTPTPNSNNIKRLIKAISNFNNRNSHRTMPQLAFNEKVSRILEALSQDSNQTQESSPIPDNHDITSNQFEHLHHLKLFIN